jgi:hypothetical protein
VQGSVIVASVVAAFQTVEDGLKTSEPLFVWICVKIRIQRGEVLRSRPLGRLPNGRESAEPVVIGEFFLEGLSPTVMTLSEEEKYLLLSPKKRIGIAGFMTNSCVLDRS